MKDQPNQSLKIDYGTVVGLIALRSGSKSITDKNVKMFCGKPLFYWAINSALSSGIFNGGVFVAVDSERYKAMVQEWLPDVNVVMRPDYTATDDATVESLMIWFIDNHPCDILSLIQVTTPTVIPSDFQLALRQFLDEKSDSLVTGVTFKRFIWHRNGSPLNYDPVFRPRRQDFNDDVMENGSFYFTKSSILKEYNSRLAGKISVHVMRNETAVEIDEPDDWEEAEEAFRMLHNLKKPAVDFSDIKVIVVDIDGTLTDGGMYYNADGEYMKKFNTRDGAAIIRFHELGYNQIVCSSESSKSVQARVEKLKIKHYFHGVSDKVGKLEEWLKSTPYNWGNVLFVGDGLNDMEIIKKSGLSFCPSDAHPEIRRSVKQVLKTKGGDGVLLEILLMMEGEYNDHS